MHSVYRDHFGLVREPFNVTPDPSFLYWSVSHKEALAQLVYGIKARKGFVVLTGEVGTGKTTLIRALLRELDGTTQSAYIFNAVASPEDLLRSVCEDFGLIEVENGPKRVSEYMKLLNQFLLETYQTDHNAALIIDEAQNLSTEVLESVRLLSNLETTSDKLLQTLLVGQPELGARLNSRELRQLKQRVALRQHLRPLSFAESREYVARRLELAGGISTIFSPKALETVFLHSGGTPRLINILCDNGLLSAYALGQRKVEASMIREIAEDLNLTVPKETENVDASRPALQAKPAALAAKPAPRRGKIAPAARRFAALVSAFSLFAVGISYVASQWNDFSFVYHTLVDEVLSWIAGL
jgi:general secretion pathway protein A